MINASIKEKMLLGQDFDLLDDSKGLNSLKIYEEIIRY